MRMKATAVMIGSLVASASALADDGAYLFIGGGLNTADKEIVSFGPAGNMRTETDSGTHWHAGLGFSPRRNLRLEAELGYASNSIDGVVLLPTVPPPVGIGVAGAGGDVESLSLLVNAWYDLSLGERWNLALGGGAGMARVSVDGYTLSTFPIVPNPPVTTSLYADDDDWVFAYQLGAGVSYDLTKRVNVDLSYRYFATDDASLTSVTGNAFEASIEDSRVLLSLRFELR